MTEIQGAPPRGTPGRRPLYQKGFCDPGARRYILVAAILASSMGFIDGSVVAIAMPAIRESLSATLVQAQWISNAYMLTLSALILAGGALGDRFGLARVFSAGIVLFVAASMVCAAAPDPEILILARAIQGIGAATMVPGSLAIISRAYPREERGRAIGIWAAAAAMTTALGPIIGGLALSIGGPGMWRWIFAVNLPFGIAALWFLNSKVQVDRSTPDTPVDWTGAVLATVALGLVAYALTGAEGGGGPERPLIWAAVGAVLLALFIWVESRSGHPMMPLELFSNRTFSAANVSTFLLYFGLSAILFYLPMTVIAGWGISPLEASAAFAPLSIFITLFSSRAGALSERIGPGRMIGAGAAMVAIAYAALAAFLPEQAYWTRVLPAMCLMGLGMSLVVAPLSTAVMASVEDTRTGAASGINNATSRIAGLVAVAAMGSVAATAYAGAGGTESFGVRAEAAGHVGAMTDALAVVVWITAALAALSAAIALVAIGKPKAAQTGA